MPLDSYVSLGRSGLRVSPFTLGAMTFGEDNGWGASPEESGSMISEYLDRGGNAIDTANMYTNGHSEKIIGDYLASRPGLRDHATLRPQPGRHAHALLARRVAAKMHAISVDLALVGLLVDQKAAPRGAAQQHHGHRSDERDTPGSSLFESPHGLSTPHHDRKLPPH